MNNLGGNRWFTLLEQGKADHQDWIKEECQHLTALVTPLWIYEWKHISFGLSRAPGIFKWCREETLDDLRDKACLPYLDDVRVFRPRSHLLYDEDTAAVRPLN